MKLATFLIAAVALAQNTPSIGLMRDAWGVWRPVEGVAGNFVLGAPVEPPAPPPASRNTVEARGEVLFIVAPDASTVAALPAEARQPILLLGDAALYSTGEELVIGQTRIPCPGVTALRRMSAEWVQVSTANREYVLRIEPGQEAIFLLPSAPRPEVRRR